MCRFSGSVEVHTTENSSGVVGTSLHFSSVGCNQEIQDIAARDGILLLQAPYYKNPARATDTLLALMHDIVKTWGIEKEKNILMDRSVKAKQVSTLAVRDSSLFVEFLDFVDKCIVGARGC
jgi:hypothetical protein